jgi:hypothetical protein
MARQLVLNHVPVDLSILEFALDCGEDVFLTYTWERREGPPIHRTGEGPPMIAVIGGVPGQSTVHPFGLRLGTWLIQEDLRDAEIEEAEKEIAGGRKRSLPSEEMEILNRTLSELRPPGRCRAHDSVFQQFFPWYEIIGEQGCGDLTMNFWNVAFVNSDLGQDPASGERPPMLVCLPEEPFENRTYSCFIKWKASETGLRRVSIEEVRFHRRAEVESPNEMAWVCYGGKWLPRGDRIEFAVSNQHVIRDGRVVPAAAICHKFGDIRHLIQMPNLNPPGPLYAGEPTKPNGQYRPRKYFREEEQFGDIWFGESAFLSDRSRNLLRAALAGPVLMALTPDLDRRQLRGAMELARYREARSELEPLSAGMWRFVRRSPTLTGVDVYFKRNTYAWTMIGLTPDNRKILCLACAGAPGGRGYKLEEAAELLIKAGAWNALLMDEGADVFQKFRNAAGNVVDMVPRIRNRLRATFVFARPRSGLGCAPGRAEPEEHPEAWGLEPSPRMDASGEAGQRVGNERSRD